MDQMSPSSTLLFFRPNLSRFTPRFCKRSPSFRISDHSFVRPFPRCLFPWLDGPTDIWQGVTNYGASRRAGLKANVCWDYCLLGCDAVWFGMYIPAASVVMVCDSQASRRIVRFGSLLRRSLRNAWISPDIVCTFAYHFGCYNWTSQNIWRNWSSVFYVQQKVCKK